MPMMVSPGCEQGQEDGEVGLGPRVGLDIGMDRPKEFLGSVDGQLLGFVDESAAAVVALARQALRRTYW
jgi:hypothetical protein